MYMYNMNQPPKKPSPLKKLIGFCYAVAAVIAVGMMLFGAFTFGKTWLSLLSTAYAFMLVGAWLYRMAKSMAEEPLFLINTVLYALLFGAAVFDVIITLAMPTQSVVERVLPIVLALPAGGMGAYQVWKNGRFLGW